MSRHTLAPRSDRPDIDHAIVGWDRPLETFFAQVFTKASPDENALVWVGDEFRAIRTPEQAIYAVQAFAVIPDDLEDRLRADFADTPARAPKMLPKFWRAPDPDQR